MGRFLILGFSSKDWPCANTYGLEVYTGKALNQYDIDRVHHCARIH